MNYIKRIIKPLSRIFIYIIIYMFILTLLNYFNIISYHTLNILKYIFLFILLIYYSYKIGLGSNSKGYLEGIKFSSIIITILIILNIIFIRNFNFKSIIYYLLILVITTSSSILGINKNKS